MKSFRPVLCLSAALLTHSLTAAPPPVPVVEITKVNLPKVEIRISNPSKTEPCHLWYRACSWAEQNKWFSLRTAAGGKVWELHRSPADYTGVNSPRIESVAPGGARAFDYDFTRYWDLPKDFVGGDWKFEIQAHLEIRYDSMSHRRGIFCGHVTSGWYDGAGREVEKPGKPAQDERHIAVESVKGFPFDRLTARLETRKTGTLPKKGSLEDFFGADFPWSDLKCSHAAARSLVVFLPECGELQINFFRDLPGAFRTRPVAGRRGKTERVPANEWRPVQEVFANTLGVKVASLVLVQGTLRTEGRILFRRYFDAKGRINKKASEDPWGLELLSIS